MLIVFGLFVCALPPSGKKNKYVRESTKKTVGAFSLYMSKVYYKLVKVCVCVHPS